MIRGVVIVAVAAVCLEVVSTPPAALAAGSGKDDVQLVYCLAPSHRADLVEAAVNLGEARTVPGDPTRMRAGRAGRTLTAPQWAGLDPDAFRRTCLALMAADAAGEPAGGGGGGGDSAGLGTALVVAAGAALFTLLGQVFERSTGGRRERARAVVTAASGPAATSTPGSATPVPRTSRWPPHAPNWRQRCAGSPPPESAAGRPRNWPVTFRWRSLRRTSTTARTPVPGI
jgi:hypothetical protein